MSNRELIERLRGKYRIGPATDGEPEFGYRQFDGFTPPIQLEAANALEALELMDIGKDGMARFKCAESKLNGKSESVLPYQKERRNENHS